MDLTSDKAPPPEENAGEATADAVVPDRDMREGIFSLSIGSCEGEEKTRGSDEKLRDDEHWGRPPEKNAGGATTTVEAEGRTRELVASFFSFTANGCDREEGKNVAAEWSSKESGLDLRFKKLGQAHVHFLKPAQYVVRGNGKWTDLVAQHETEAEWSLSGMGLSSMSKGQAQLQVSHSGHLYINRGVLKEKREVLKEKAVKENELSGFSWSQSKVDLTFNSMGQTHNFIITPTIFTNSGGQLQEEMKIDKEVLARSGLVGKFGKPHFIKNVSNFGEGKCSNVYLASNCCSTFVIKFSQFQNEGREECHEEREIKDRRGLFLQNLKHWDTNLFDIGDVKEVGDNMNCGIVLHLLFTRIVKMINLLVGVGGNYNNGSIQLTNISMEKPPLVQQWELGGLKMYGWDPGGSKENVNKQESATTYTCSGIQENQHHQLCNSDQYFCMPAICTLLETCKFEAGCVQNTIGLMVKGEVKEKVKWGDEREGLDSRDILLPYCAEDPSIQVNDSSVIHVTIHQILVVEPSAPHKNYSSRKDFKGVKGVQFSFIGFISSDTVQPTHHKRWHREEYDYVSCIIGTPCFKLWDSGELYSVSCIAWSSCLKLWDLGGRLLQMLEYHWLIQKMKVLELSQVMHKDVEVLVKWNQHPNCENLSELHTELLNEFSQSYIEDKVNIIQAGLQNSKEMFCAWEKMTRKFLHKGQVDYGVMSYQSSTSLGLVVWEVLQQWDSGGNHYSPVACLALSLWFQLWDPGGRPLSLLFYHLEDKVKFKGGSIDENLALPNSIGQVYSRKGRKGINWEFSSGVGRIVTNLLSWQERENGMESVGICSRILAEL